MSKEAMKLAQDLRTLADRFSEGWHDGIKIDASEIMLLTDAAATLASEAKEQPAQQEPAFYRHEDGHLMTPDRAKFLGFDLNDLQALYTSPPASKPLTQDMVESCPYHGETLRGAFFDGWIKAEAAHGIKENT